MTSLDDYLQMLQTDCSLLAVELRANDPRTFPTEVITLVLEDDSSLAEVEAFAGALAQDYQWGNGHLMHVRKWLFRPECGLSMAARWGLG